MSRPEHLPCVNTPEGIRRINENQAAYDKDPAEDEWRAQEEAMAMAQYEEEQRDKANYEATEAHAQEQEYLNQCGPDCGPEGE